MDENNEYFKCFRLLFHTMKLCGIFPFLFSHKGTSKHLYISKILTFLSVAIFIPLCAQQYISVVKNINLVLVNFRFDTFVRVLPPITTRIAFLLIPLVTWRSHKQVYIHLKKWQKLQDTLTSIQKSPYSSPLKYIIPSMNVIFMAISISILLPLKPYFDLNAALSTSVPSFLHLGVACLSIVLYWVSNSLFVIFVAKAFLVLIENSIISNNQDSFTRLVKVWVDLYDWNAEFSSTISIMFLILLTSMIITLVACFYTLTFAIVVEDDIIASLAYFTFATSCFLILLLFCESANFLTKQIAIKIQNTILNSNTSGMNMRLMQVMLVFLQTIDVKQPKIMVNGVMIINRSSMISIFSTTINFLIVLKQFNIRPGQQF